MLLNPLGFAFEHYDPLGRYRDTDNGSPVNAQGTYTFSEGTRSFDGAVELMGIIAQGQQAHDCYSKRMFEYLYGREATADPSDVGLITELGRRSRRSASVKSLILELVSTDAFLNRQP